MRLILYSKPGCHLCEGLQEKLEQIRSLPLELEVRDITTREDWFQAYQYEVPVLFVDRSQESGSPQSSVLNSQSLDQHQESGIRNQDFLSPIPRPSPRVSVQQLERLLQNYLSEISKGI